MGGGGGGGGGVLSSQKKFLSKIQPDLVCELLTSMTHATAQFFGSPPPGQGSNFSSHTRKMRVKKAISEEVFSQLAFSHEWKFGAVIRGSYPRYKSSLQFH